MGSLHASGITHRTVRPDHILIDADGHIVLTGFADATVVGIASPRDFFGTRQSPLQHGSFAYNTPDLDEWSAPELILNWSHDSAVDSWGFGMVLYFMITGQVSV